MPEIKKFSLALLIWTIFVLFSHQSIAAEYRYFSILAETMRPIDSSIEFNCNDGNLRTMTDSSLNGSTQYIGQVNLPHGTTIVNASCYGYDDDTTDFQFALFRYRFNGVGNPVFEAITNHGFSSTAPGSYAEITVGLVSPLDPPGLAVVNNEDYSYGLFLGLPKAITNELYVVRCVVRAALEGTSHFHRVEIK